MKQFLSRLSRRDRPEPVASVAAVSDGRRIYAIGDVHGRLDLLDDLLATIGGDLAGFGGDATIVFLGDLIDRGPASAGVIGRLAAASCCPAPAIFLMGNHEEAMLRTLEGDVPAMRLWLRIGGRETLASYGIDDYALREATDDDLLCAVQATVPADHHAFLSAMRDSFACGDYLFVHAGIRPGVAIEAQTPADLRWIRAEFLDSIADHGCVVVHGHSIVPEPESLTNRIAIDTGAYHSGLLTALVLEGTGRRFLSARRTP